MTGMKSPSSFSRLYSMDGMTVSLQVQQVGGGEWVLRIHGRQGQVSEWLQCFDSLIEAMSAGLSAIQLEGIERFYADPILRRHKSPTGSLH